MHVLAPLGFVNLRTSRAMMGTDLGQEAPIQSKYIAYEITRFALFLIAKRIKLLDILRPFRLKIVLIIGRDSAFIRAIEIGDIELISARAIACVHQMTTIR